MVKHAFRESPHTVCHISSNAIGCPIISNSRQSICNLIEQDCSKNDKEPASPSSLNSSMEESAADEVTCTPCRYERKTTDSLVTSNTRWTNHNLNEQNHSTNNKESASPRSLSLNMTGDVMDGVQNSIESSFPVQPCKFQVQYHSKMNDNRASISPVNLQLANDSPTSTQQLNDNAIHGLQSSSVSSLPVQFPCKFKVQHH